MFHTTLAGLRKVIANQHDWVKYALCVAEIVSLAVVAACSTGGGGNGSGVGVGNGGRGGNGNAQSAGIASSYAGSSSAYIVTKATGGNSAVDAQAAYGPQNLVAIRLVPENPVIGVALGQSASITFQALGVMTTGGTETEITNRTAFYVPDRCLVGGFSSAAAALAADGRTYLFPDGNATFTTRLPTVAADPPQQGGVVTVQAQAANSDGSMTTATTTITVRLTGSVLAPSGTPQATPTIPANPQTLFQGTPTATLAPTLVYPNNGVMLPPNLRRLEIHWKPATGATLYEIGFAADTVDIRCYARCAADSTLFDPGSCAFELDSPTFGEIAESTRGLGPLTLTVRATDELGHVGTSQAFSIEFAENRVDGTVYYWMAASQTNSTPQVVRYEFGSLQTAPESILKQSDIPNNWACVGCHSLSRDGTKMAAGLDSSWSAKLVYIKDLAAFENTKSNANAAIAYIGALDPTVNPTQNSSLNRVLMTSFAPDGNTFVGQPPLGDTTITNPANNVCFHDGTTGIRRSRRLVLPPCSWRMRQGPA